MNTDKNNNLDTPTGERLAMHLLGPTPNADFRAKLVQVTLLREFCRDGSESRVMATVELASAAIEKLYFSYLMLEMAIEGDRLDRDELRMLVEEMRRDAAMEAAACPLESDEEGDSGGR